MKRIIDVVLFLGERGLAFRGSSQRIGDPHNGNFLGIIELVSRYDPVLQLHVNKVGAQEQGNRLPVHYLSSDSQNEFIAACAGQVQAKILYQLKEAKYYCRCYTRFCTHGTNNIHIKIRVITTRWN